MGLIRNRYPIKVKLNEVRGNVVWIKWMKARWKTDRSTKESYLQLSLIKVKLSNIKYEDLQQSDQGAFLELWSDGENAFYTKDQWFAKNPISEVGVNKDKVEQKLMNWLANDNKQATLRWKKSGGWSWILPIIPIVIVLVVSVIALMLFMNSYGDYVKNTVAPLQQTAAATQLAAANIAEGMRVMIETLKAMGFQVNETALLNNSIKDLSYLTR